MKLCLCLTYDASLVAGAEPYIQVMIVLPELRQPRFKRLLRKRQRLIVFLEEFIPQAVDEGDFRRIDPPQAAMQPRRGYFRARPSTLRRNSRTTGSRSSQAEASARDSSTWLGAPTKPAGIWLTSTGGSSV